MNIVLGYYLLCYISNNVAKRVNRRKNTGYTILLGAIATIIGMLVMGRIPNPKAKVFDNKLSDDHFAIFLPDQKMESDSVQILKDCGACEVKVV